MRIYKRATKGFTLLEVMMVVLIIGIITSLAVYSLAKVGPSRHAKSEAQALMAALDYAQQQAILMHQPYGLVLKSQGYQFFKYSSSSQNAGQNQGQWQPIDTKSLHKSNSLSEFHLRTPKPNIDGSPSVLLLPSKEPQVYVIEISLDGYTWLLSSLPPKPIKLEALTNE